MTNQQRMRQLRKLRDVGLWTPPTAECNPRYLKAKAIGIIAAVAMFFVVRATRLDRGLLAEFFLALCTGALLGVAFYFRSTAPRSRDELIDQALSEYMPVSLPAYTYLQEKVRVTGVVSQQDLREWVASEKAAVLEEPDIKAAQYHWAFTNKQHGSEKENV